MKQSFTLIFLWSLIANITGQPSISMQVIASVGGFSSGEAGSLSYTMGETVTATYSSGDFFLTQGFQQTDFQTVSAEKLIPQDFQVKVFPNPATEFVRVEWETPDQTEVYVELFDLVGRRIIQRKSDIAVNHIQIEMQSLQRSAYLLKVYTLDGKYSRTYRIVKY